MNFLSFIFKGAALRKNAHSLYSETIKAARAPAFYNDWGVPDTPEGRFEALALTAFLVLRRLKSIGFTDKLAQVYFDIMLEDLDSNLREMGVGDNTIGKKVQKLAGSLYGRIRAYETAMGPTDMDASPVTEASEVPTLTETLRKHLFRDSDPSEQTLDAAAAFVKAQDEFIASQDALDLNEGRIRFLTPGDSN